MEHVEAGVETQRLMASTYVLDLLPLNRPKWRSCQGSDFQALRVVQISCNAPWHLLDLWHSW